MVHQQGFVQFGYLLRILTMELPTNIQLHILNIYAVLDFVHYTLHMKNRQNIYTIILKLDVLQAVAYIWYYFHEVAYYK